MSEAQAMLSGMKDIRERAVDTIKGHIQLSPECIY
jgi:hypothetical protein